ncbi:glycosyl hydrolase 115 family protein [Duganella aceris]|uniref:Gylcosyl hydrolase 115 C-terminal domain-containing protein n=1 Tax=Duganella aceris TaxID=2703883 RepID=A0ABX0FQT9_9BURK|nr:glycosyl hydrolase 115 family protein [Duganella aceris]NGZ86879.1 hypothetical protein [Duganella aceris]
MKKLKPLIQTTLAAALLAACGASLAAPLPLLARDGAPSVLAEQQETIQIAAALLRRDLAAVTGLPSSAVDKVDDCAQVCFVLGRHDSALMAGIAKAAGVDLAWLQDQWERYERVGVALPGKAGKTLVLIAGSDARGTAYGAIDVTREIGVSAWEWWADAPPPIQPGVAIDGARIRSAAPTVQYRGIFLNDEDWGLQPWAARHDPSGDIGPATYARIFELMLRLKANLIWPAMHDSTTPFYQMAGNAAVARQYGIVVGTSHAEPMMRNNVREWDHQRRGDFNFFTNRAALVDYWAERVEQVKQYENLYSVGIRGVHDSAMEGAGSIAEARDAVQEVIDTERRLLSKALGKPAERIPQALTLYKEVLDIYQAGLKVPDDITLVWPDDNYGYLHQLSTPAEARRGGGTGLYYHLSYWGRPHDYLWLGTTHPELVRDQLQRAVATGTRKVWVVNVGDIKPIEYLTQYFLDAAFDATQLRRPAQDHLAHWLATQFGAAHAAPIAEVMRDYYDLAWERRPEFMGFSQVEPITPVRQSAYLAGGGEEAERRLRRYEALARRARDLGAALPSHLREAYFQLVLYPVQSSANLNLRILKLDLAAQYAREGRPIASLYASQAAEAQRAIDRDTAQYNAMGRGKWTGMMDAAPRRLPVFAAPLMPGYEQTARTASPLVDPAPMSRQGESIPLARGAADQRVDEQQHIVALPAAKGIAAKGWSLLPGLGSYGASMRADLDLPSRGLEQADAAPVLSYAFSTATSGAAQLIFVGLPVHALTSANKVRMAYSLDGGAPQLLDFATHGRSDEWKTNVLSNTAVRRVALPALKPGAHALRVFALDPGVVLDRIEIKFDGAPAYYGKPL